MDLQRNNLLGSLLYPNINYKKSPLLILLCGSEESGKNYLGHAITRLLKWKNHNVSLVNTAENTDLEKLNISIEFLKNEITFSKSRTDSLAKAGGCKNIAIINCNRSTAENRDEMCKLAHLNYIQVMFIESLLNLNDYSPISSDIKSELYSYISINSKGIYNHLIDSYIPLTVSSFLSSKFQLNVGNSIYLCRHGESIANTKSLIGGDYDITENGKKFGLALGKYMKEVEPYGIPIWTSTLQRTINTALKCQEAARGTDPLLQWTALDEIHGGMFEEHTFDYVKQNYPEVHSSRKKDKFNFVYPNRGESYAMLTQRIEPVILCLERQTSNILIICHTAVLRMLLAYLLDLDKEEATVRDVPLNRVYKITKGITNNTCEEIDLV